MLSLELLSDIDALKYYSQRKRLSRKYSANSRNGDLFRTRFRRRSGGLEKQNADNNVKAYTHSFIIDDLRLLFTVSLPKQVVTCLDKFAVYSEYKLLLST